MDIKVRVSAAGPIPSQAMYQCEVLVEFGGPIETMHMTVIIPREDEEAAIQARAIARARELARLFCGTKPA